MQDPFNQYAHGTAVAFPTFENFREVLDSCPFITVVLNQLRQIVFFNRALAALSGPIEETLYGRKLGDALRCDHVQAGIECGTDPDCHACGAFLAVTDGLGGRSSVREARLIRKVSGLAEFHDVQVSVAPIVAGGERFVACFIRDITHEKRREMLERIFFHDILNSATGVELLASGLNHMVDGDASAFAGQIRACASQMVDEIHSQQQLLSAEKDELAVNIASLTTGSVMRDVETVSRSSALMNDRTLRLAPDSQDVTFETDASILRRVLKNMILNALEACPPGATVEVGCRDRGGEVEFWVLNPGVISEAVRTQIFQKSFSTRGAGRGLGTYCIKLLSERYLNGAVRFRSSKSEGTCFLARFPKKQHVGRQAAH